MTNNQVVLSRVRRMRKIQRMIAEGEVDKMPKKEAARLRRELMKLERNLGGIADMRGLPAVMVVVDVMREAIAVKEAKKLDLPVVAIVDSNCDPEPIDRVIPGNDDAVRAIKVIIDALKAAVEEGRLAYGKESPSAAGTPEPAGAPAEAVTPPSAPAAAPTPMPASEEPAPDLPPTETSPETPSETPAETPGAEEETAPPEPSTPADEETPAEEESVEDAVPASEEAPAEEPAEEETPTQATDKA